MTLNKRCFIIGSGASMKHGVDNGLFDLLKNEVTFGLNETIRFFQPTVAVVGDYYCYHSRYAWFVLHNLVVARNSCEFNHPEFDFQKQDDLILLNASSEYNAENSLEMGCYSPVLTGAFTLSLAIALGFTEIGLLGFDCNATKNMTHWYQHIPGAGVFQDLDGIKRCGVGFKKDNTYNSEIYNYQEKLNKLWEPFKKPKYLSIINVSPNSAINVFPKCNMDYLMDSLKETTQSINQNEVRSHLRLIMEPYNKFRT